MIASMITGVLRAKQQSWRPLIMSSSGSSVTKLRVVCALAIEEVGLTATRNIIGFPFDMPPFIPPAPLREVLPSLVINGSLCSEPLIRAA